MEEKRNDILKSYGKLAFRTQFHQWQSVYITISELLIQIYTDEYCNSIIKEFTLPENAQIKITNYEKFEFCIYANNKNFAKFRADDFTTMEQWIISFRSILFTQPSISVDSFNLIAVIGRGYFGKVMLVSKKDTGDLYAIKTVHKKKLIEKNMIDSLVSERNVLTQTNHPFIVKLHYAFQTPSKFYLVIDYCPGGELFFRMDSEGCLSIEETKFYVAQIALAIDYLHSLDIVYNDLKPENILIDSDGYLKLTDFGLAMNVHSKKYLNYFACGTKEYLSPEIILKKSRGFATDWWALGILFYEILFGCSPFYDDDYLVMFRKVIDEQVCFPPDANKLAADLIRGLLDKDPNKRFTFKEIKEHQFFVNFDWDGILKRHIKPKYIPVLKNSLSLGCFDSEFTCELPIDSFASPVPSSDEIIDNFSFDSKYFTPSDICSSGSADFEIIKQEINTSTDFQ